MKHYILFFLKALFPTRMFSRRSYSQFGEDLLIDSILQYPKGYRGFYVDVGAHHPFALSNTAYFYKKGWQGINIEASPSLMTKFKIFRRRDINLNYAVGSSAQPLDFHVFKNYQPFNCFDKDMAKERINSGLHLKEVIKIRQVRLDVLLDKYLNGSSIDFMTIDVEGLDLDVLKTNNWEKYRPKVLVTEDYDTTDDSSISNFIESKGYSKVAFLKGHVGIYKRKD